MKKIAAYLLPMALLLAACGSETTPGSTVTEEKKPVAKLGETLKTEYFDVTVKKVLAVPYIKVESEFIDMKQEPNTLYLIIFTTYKNTDTESRMMDDGEVITEHNGKQMLYDKSETFLAEGWGTMLDQINPLTEKTTRMVFKVSTELTGNLYYKPSRSGDDDLIDLGTLPQIIEAQKKKDK